MDAMALTSSLVPQLRFGGPRNDHAQGDLQEPAARALVNLALELVRAETAGCILTQDELDERALWEALHCVADLEHMDVDGYEPSLAPSDAGFELVAHAPDLQGYQHHHGVPPQQESEKAPTASSAKQDTCQRLRATRKGANKYYEQVTCLDCNKVLVKRGQNHKVVRPPRRPPLPRHLLSSNSSVDTTASPGVEAMAIRPGGLALIAASSALDIQNPLR